MPDASGGGSATAAPREVLVDYQPSSPVRPTTTDDFFELPAAAAFSRVLTAMDDNRMMTIEISVSQRSNSANYPFGPPLTIPASSWRTARQAASGASYNQVDGWTANTLYAGEATDRLVNMLIGKGRNNRVGYVPSNSAAYVQRLRVTLMPVSNGLTQIALTQAEYDALTRRGSNTVYHITD